MAISSLADFKSALASPHQQIVGFKGTAGATNGVQGIYSTWLNAGKAGAAPTTAAACTQDTVGALGKFTNPASGTLRMLKRVVYPTYSTGNLGIYPVALLDRLCHQGGLSGVVTSAQTTNLPTAALTRFTDGVGVMPFIEIYTAIGSTATTGVISYTNQDGLAGQTSQAFVVGGSSNPNQGRASGSMYAIGLADGDTGCRSVESVTLAGTTGTAGAFGVTLAKPIALLSMPVLNQVVLNTLFGGGGCGCSLPSNACIMACPILQTQTTGGSGFGIELDLIRGTT